MLEAEVAANGLARHCEFHAETLDLHIRSLRQIQCDDIICKNIASDDIGLVDCRGCRRLHNAEIGCGVRVRAWIHLDIEAVRSDLRRIVREDKLGVFQPHKCPTGGGVDLSDDIAKRRRAAEVDEFDVAVAERDLNLRTRAVDADAGTAAE